MQNFIQIGYPKCDEEKEEEEKTTHFSPFWHRCKMAVTWLYATLLISGQHADVNIWSILHFFRFLPRDAMHPRY